MTELKPDLAAAPVPAHPAITVVAPMRNESAYVEDLVADLAAQDVQEEFEVIIADGGSTDGSPNLLKAAAERAGLRLTLLDNPRGFASPGLNLCIREAKGDIIVRFDCHTRYPPDYVRRCVEGVRETGAWNVGGIFTAIGTTPIERAVACALDSPFGGHNWTRKAAAGRRIEVDTNYLGAFPREALERVGLYDEELVVTEVEDLNLSLQRAGGKVLLDPDIRSYYRPRGSFGDLFHQYFRYGYWKVAAMVKHRAVLSARSVVPCVFVLSLVGLGIACVFGVTARWLLFAELAIYALGALVFGVLAIRRRKETLRLLPLVMAAFATFHVSHGLGMLGGVGRQLLRKNP